MNTANEQTGPPTPPEVPAKATRSGSSREQEWGTLRLSHDSTMVWTERMLAALGRGNDARQWHTLIDKVFSPKTLALAFASVTKRDRAAGVDGITTQAMRQREAEELPVIERLLREDRYEPQPVRRVWIEKPGSREKRPLGIPTVRDRIVQQALRAIIKRVNSITRGWANYFRGGVQNVPKSLDPWVRMRLRSILRKRDKRKGRGHGRDHNRYPNAWFAERGLVFLITITHDSAASPTK